MLLQLQCQQHHVSSNALLRLPCRIQGSHLGIPFTVICNSLLQNVNCFSTALPVCRPGNKSAALAPAVSPIESPDDDARLSTLVVAGRNGTIFDLSPSFQPNVAQYGAMVGADCKDATLCFETLEGQRHLKLLTSCSDDVWS